MGQKDTLSEEDKLKDIKVTFDGMDYIFSYDTYNRMQKWFNKKENKQTSYFTFLNLGKDDN